MQITNTKYRPRACGKSQSKSVVSHSRYRLFCVRLRSVIALVSLRSLAGTPKVCLSWAGHFANHSPTDRPTDHTKLSQGPATLLLGRAGAARGAEEWGSRCLGGHAQPTAAPGPAPRCPRAMPCSGAASPLGTSAKFTKPHRHKTASTIFEHTWPPSNLPRHTGAIYHHRCPLAPRWYPSPTTQDVLGRSRVLHHLKPLRKNLNPQRLGVLLSTALSMFPVLFISRSPAGGNGSGALQAAAQATTALTATSPLGICQVK